MSPEVKFPYEVEGTIRPLVFIKTPGGYGEQTTAEGRSPSPTSRFSFSLGRMGRSFSFKESLVVPHLNSTYTLVKSGTVRCEVANCIDSLDRDQANSSRKARSCPFRRLLDSWLKHNARSDNVRSLKSKLTLHDDRSHKHKGTSSR